MGYYEISIDGSDLASDLNGDIEDCATEQERVNTLFGELYSEHDEYNTPGVVNVALVLTEGAGRQLKNVNLIKETIRGLKHYQKRWEKEDCMMQFNGTDGKEYHVSRVKELISLLKAKL